MSKGAGKSYVIYFLSEYEPQLRNSLICESFGQKKRLNCKNRGALLRMCMILVFFLIILN